MNIKLKTNYNKTLDTISKKEFKKYLYSEEKKIKQIKDLNSNKIYILAALKEFNISSKEKIMKIKKNISKFCYHLGFQLTDEDSAKKIIKTFEAEDINNILGDLSKNGIFTKEGRLETGKDTMTLMNQIIYKIVRIKKDINLIKNKKSGYNTEMIITENNLN